MHRSTKITEGTEVTVQGLQDICLGCKLCSKGLLQGIDRRYTELFVADELQPFGQSFGCYFLL